MPTIVGTSGVRHLVEEYRMGVDPADKWAHAVEWHVAVCELLFHNNHEVPDHWEFVDSPMHGGNEYFTDPPDSYESDILSEMYGDWTVDETDIRTFGEIMHRYKRILREAGESY